MSRPDLKNIDIDWLDPNDRPVEIDAPAESTDSPPNLVTPRRGSSINAPWETIIGIPSNRTNSAAYHQSSISSPYRIPQPAPPYPFPPSADVTDGFQSFIADSDTEQGLSAVDGPPSCASSVVHLSSWCCAFPKSPQPTVEEIGLGRQLFPIGDDRFRDGGRVMYIQVIRCMVVVVNLIAGIWLVVSIFVLRSDFPILQIFLLMCYCIVPFSLQMATSEAVRTHDADGIPLPPRQPKWYWGLLALTAHLSWVFAIGYFVAFFIVKLVPILGQSSAIAEKYAITSFDSVRSVQRYVMAASGVVEVLLAIVPQHYAYTWIAFCWCVTWNIVSSFLYPLIDSHAPEAGVVAVVEPLVSVVGVLAISSIVVFTQPRLGRLYRRIFVVDDSSRACCEAAKVKAVTVDGGDSSDGEEGKCGKSDVSSRGSKKEKKSRPSRSSSV